MNRRGSCLLLVVPFLMLIGTVTQAPAQSKVANPNFSPVEGHYRSTQQVSITCATAGASIRYTTNGSIPTETSALYIRPIEVAQNARVTAKAFKASLLPSDAVAAYYLIEKGDATDLYLSSDWSLTEQIGSANSRTLFLYPEGSSTSYEWQTVLTGDISGGYHFQIDVLTCLAPAKIKLELFVNQNGITTLTTRIGVALPPLSSGYYIPISFFDVGLDLQTQDGDLLVFKITQTEGTQGVGIGLGGTTATYDSRIGVYYRGPIPCLSVLPQQGGLDTIFFFDAACSSDVDYATSELEVRWDWDNDGTYDTSFSTTKTASYQFASAGVQYVKLEVRNPDGLVRSKIIKIMIDPPSFGERYKFERMWPTLQQPWFCRESFGIAISNKDYVYIADHYGNCVRKYTLDGSFVTKWGRTGSGDGEFSYPRGVAVDNTGDVYVADHDNHRIQKFDANGKFITKWGTEGPGDGQFNSVFGVAVDTLGNVYVTDQTAQRVQKFTPEGAFLQKWLNFGSAIGQFDHPQGIAVGVGGRIYVADSLHDRILIFNPEGTYLGEWGTSGEGDGQFDHGVIGIAVDKDGYVYVADTQRKEKQIQKFSPDGEFILGWGKLDDADGNLAGALGIAIDSQGYVYTTEQSEERIQKFTTDGNFITKWAATGREAGKFQGCLGMVASNDGSVYIVDHLNDRIQKFSASGEFVFQWGSHGSEPGMFWGPVDIAEDSSGNVYVTDSGNHRVQKFTSNGEFLTQWGIEGSGGTYWDPYGIAIDTQGNVYATSVLTSRVYKFTSSGIYLDTWGETGGGVGFTWPMGIAADRHNNIYVADHVNSRICKLTADGTLLKTWGKRGTGDGEFALFVAGVTDGFAVATDNEDNVYVADTWNHRIQKFDSEGNFLGKWGTQGTDPGQWQFPVYVEIASNGKIYVSDMKNNRVQVFKNLPLNKNNKAIILAGGGPFPGNTLWDATQMSANFAYRALTYQGFTKKSIYYLSSDTNLDLDNNGLADDVNGDATKANLQHAITTWAADAEKLMIYLVDHGGTGTFRMSGTETVSSSELNSWISTLQASMPGRVTIVYDACESGSFLSALSGASRTVITSTSPGESAYFVNQGSVSFSSHFWTHVFNGLSVKDAFNLASTAIVYATDFQHPMLDADGDGVENESEDYVLAQNQWIGNGTEICGEVPVIGSVSDAQSISGMSTAVLTASGVTDNDGIARVWAMIRPPDYIQGSSSNPVQGLPSVDLLPKGNGEYEASYSGFNITGTYHVVIYARDTIGNSSIPKLTTVTVGSPLRRKAVIVCGGSQGDALWPAVEKIGTMTYEALRFQGYKDEDIYFLSPVSFSSGVDGMATLRNLEYALTTWARQSTEDLVVCLVGRGAYGTFHINPTETLTATQLDRWLDSLQTSLPGKVTVVYDGDYAGSFVPNLVPPGGKQRIVIASTTASQRAQLPSNGDISFSKYFWRKVLNGASLRDAFQEARAAMAYCGDQAAGLDDTANGVANEKGDGNVARHYTLGVGIMLAGDDPVVGSVAPGQTLYGTTTATIWAENITTSGSIQKVWAVVSAPGYLDEMMGGSVSIVELTDTGGGHYEGSLSGLTSYGRYEIGVYAMDTEENVSLPKGTFVFQEVSPDLYEEDDTTGKAWVIVVGNGEAQRHNFHDEGDEDWVKFHGVGGETYEIKTENLGSNCDTVISVYGGSGETPVAGPRDDVGYGEGELLSWLCPADGVYYVKVAGFNPSVYGANTGYDLRVYRPILEGAGWIKGRVVNSAGSGLGDAIVKTSPGLASAISFPEGSYLLVVDAGTYSITASLGGYPQQTKTGIEVVQESFLTLDFNLSVSGDVTGDGTTDLADAILSLQIMAGKKPTGLRANFAASGADVNEDGKVGLQDVIYILQKAAGLR